MAGAVQVGALVINMAADVASLKASLAEAGRAAQTSAEKMAGDLGAVRKSIESAIDPLKKLTVNFGSLESQAKSAQSSVLALGKGLILGAAAGMSIDAIKNKIMGVIDTMAHLKDVSEKTGSSVENLSKLGFIAKQSGSDIDSVAGALTKMAKGMAGADNDTKGAGLALKFLGISAKDAAGNLKDPAAMFTEVAQKLDGYKDGAGKAAIAQALFGKAGADMLPTLKLLAEQGDMAAKVMDEQSTAARQYNRDLAKLEAQKGMLFKTIATALLPTMTDFANVLLDASKNANIVNGSVKGFAEDKSIEDWADDAAMGLALLIDTFKLMPSLFSTAASGFKTLAADAKVAALSLPGAMIVTKIAGGAPIDNLKAALKEQEAAAIEYGGKVLALLEKEVDGTRKAMQAKIDARRSASGIIAAEAAKAAAVAKEAAKKDANFNTSGEDGDTKKTASINKEAASYATLISAIRAKTAENQLELAAVDAGTPSQKERIKMDQELASGKLKLTASHIASARAALDDQAATESMIKTQKTEKEVFELILQSTAARNESKASLESEYALYGKTSDARAIAMVGIKAQAELEKEIEKFRAAKKPLTEESINQLTREKDERVKVEKATLAQGKALSYASQLADENKRFAAESIFDEQSRVAALLQIDADMWQQRIQLAGDGTEAQKKLQGEYGTWYQNQLLKPQLDADKKMWASIESTAHDTFVSIFDSGKSAFNRLRDTLKNGLLDLLYQMTIKKWIFNIGASVGMTSAAGIAQAAGSATGGPSLIGAAQSASSIFSAISNGLSGLTTSVADAVQAGMYQAGMTTQIASNGGVANFAGQAAGTVGGYMLGSSLNSAISGQYQTGSGVQTVEKIATAVASAFGPQFGAIAGAISGLVNRAFGMGPKTTDSMTLNGSLGANGFSGTTDTAWSQKGGWFRSDKNGVDKAALDATASKSLSSAYDQIKSASTDFAKTLGLNADSIKDRAQSMSIALTADKAANEKAIADFFIGVGDTIAKDLLPNLADFAKAGEAASTTLQRLAGDFQATDQFAAMLGKSAADVFGAVGIASAAARERLIALSGGVAALGSKAQAYSQAFLTDAEKIAPVIKTVGAAMASLGLASITTKDQFKAIVNGLNLATEAGAKEYASLMDLAPAFAQAADYADALTKATLDKAASDKAAADALALSVSKEQHGLDIQLMTAMGDAEGALAATRKDTLAALLSDQARVTQAQIWAADAASAAVAKAQESAKAMQAAAAAQQAAAKASYSDFGNALVGAMNNATAAAKALRAFNDSLLLGNLSPLSKGAQYDIAKQAYMSGGDQASATAFLQASQAKGGPKLDYARDFAAVIANTSAAAAGKDATAAAAPAIWAAFQRAQMFDGSHANGKDYIPFDGYRMIAHKGEGVLTAAENKAYRSGGGDTATRENSELLRQVLVELKAGNRDAKDTATILRRVTKDGKSLLTKAA